ISQDSFPNAGSAGAVVIARSLLFPDALAGTPLACVKNAPLLLTPQAVLDGRTQAELQRVLGSGGTVYILGGVNAISQGVENAIRSLGYNIVRLGGIDRFFTAVKIALAGLGSP